MRKIIAALVLMLASMSSFAATEIWMMHSPTCGFCQQFLKDHNLEGINSGEFILMYRNGYGRENAEIRLVIVNLTYVNFPERVRKAALGDPEWRGIPYTPYFYRWDTETETITGHWGRGWNKRMKADFREWVLE